MGAAVGGRRGGVLAEMNVVPLIDILLVLLIIFMVITPATPRGLDVLIPQPQLQTDAAPLLPPSTVVVQVWDLDEVRINGERSDWESLGARLSEIFKTRAEKIAFVKGDDDVKFAEVARAIDIMKTSGIDKVGLMTAKIEAGQ